MMHHIRILLFLLIRAAIPGFAQISISDTVQNTIAWEYLLDELMIVGETHDQYNSTARYYKNDPLTSSDQLLEKLSGISGMRRGNYAFEPVMRGLSAGQINVTIDEMRILGACTDKMDPVTSYVEPNNLEKLNITHGAGGYQSGSTVGGAFDMQISKPVFGSNRNWQSNFGSRYLTANNGIETLFNNAYSSEKLSTRIGATYRKGENYRAGGGEIVQHSGFNKVNYSASASYLAGKSDLLNLSLIGDHAWDVGYPALPMDVGRADAIILGLTYDKWLSRPFWKQFTAKGYMNFVNHIMDDSQRDVAVRMDMPGFTRTFGGFMKGNFIHGKLEGSVKLDTYSTFAYAEMTMYFDESPPMFMLTWPEIRRNVLGMQAATTYHLNPKTKLNAGFRLEGNTASMQSALGKSQFSVFGFGEPNPGEVLINANIGIDKEMNSKYNTQISAGFGQRMPTESEQYGFYLFNAYDGYDYIGRPDLRSEESLQGQATITRKGKIVRLSVTGFYYYFNRYIIGLPDPELSPMTIGANGVKVYQNLDHAMLTGMETQINIKIPHLELMNMTRYSYGQTVDGQPLPLIPPLKNNLNINYQVKGAFRMIAELESGMAQKRVNLDFGEDATAGYTIVNLKLSNTFSFEKTTLIMLVGCDNIFDNYYHEHLDWGNIPRMGRNLSISAMISF